MKEVNLCGDCTIDISHKRTDAKRCDDCRKKYRKEVFFPRYRKTENRKITVKNDNDSQIARERKKRYNKSMKGKAMHKKYRLSEKGRISGRNQVIRRRAKLKGLSSDLTSSQLKSIKKNFSRCVYCGSIKDLEYEHLIPISLGGNHTYHNVVRACKVCNIKKSNKELLKWFKENPDKLKYYVDMNGFHGSVSDLLGSF